MGPWGKGRNSLNPSYNFAYLDEPSKKSIRRSLLKAVAVPGSQVPFIAGEMPLPGGWGAGALQVTASVIGKADRLRVMDQGEDNTVTALNVKDFFKAVTGIAMAVDTGSATLIQTRHRIPDSPLETHQILVYHAPRPDPLQSVAASKSEAAKMHAFDEYGPLYMRLYDEIARYGHIAIPFDYPVRVHHRYIMCPGQIPKSDCPKLHHSPALHFFASGREKRICAIPPYTHVAGIDFEDYPFDPGFDPGFDPEPHPTRIPRAPRDTRAAAPEHGGGGK